MLSYGGGPFERDPETSEGIRQYFEKQNKMEYPNLYAAIEVALPRFSEVACERGRPVEKITRIEYVNKLREVEATGWGMDKYKTKPYSHMSKDELKNCLQNVRSDLRELGRTRFPGLLKRLRQHNSNATRNAKGFR